MLPQLVLRARCQLWERAAELAAFRTGIYEALDDDQIVLLVAPGVCYLTQAQQKVLLAAEASGKAGEDGEDDDDDDDDDED
jgi:hypothetical protein